MLTCSVCAAGGNEAAASLALPLLDVEVGAAEVVLALLELVETPAAGPGVAVAAVGHAGVLLGCDLSLIHKLHRASQCR